MSETVVWKRCRLYKRKDEDGYEPIVKMVQRFILGMGKLMCQ